MKARWLVLALVAGLAVPFIVPAFAADQTVEARPSNSFNPTPIAVQPGDTVTFDNVGGTHNVRWNDGLEPNEPPNPAPASPAWSADRTFDTEGTYRYYCGLHGSPNGGMSGVVHVNAAGTVPTDTGPTNTTPTNTGPTPTDPYQPPPPGSDTQQPSIGSVDAEPSRFCTRRYDDCDDPGTTFSFNLSEAARINARVRRVRRRAGAARLPRFSFDGQQGLNTRRFSGRRLKAGRYRLRLRATDTAGNRSTAVRIPFRVVAP